MANPNKGPRSVAFVARNGASIVAPGFDGRGYDIVAMSSNLGKVYAPNAHSTSLAYEHVKAVVDAHDLPEEVRTRLIELVLSLESPDPSTAGAAGIGIGKLVMGASGPLVRAALKQLGVSEE